MIKEKILLVSCFGLGNGGIQAVLMNIVRNLSNLYTFDIVLFTNDSGYYEEEFLSYGGKIFRTPYYDGKNKIRKKMDYFLRGPRLYYQLKKIIKENGPYKAIHCNNGYDRAIFLKAAYFCGIPIRILHSHNVLTDRKHFLFNLFKLYYVKSIPKYATHLIGCSKDACTSLFGEQTPYSVVPNPYNSKRFTPNIDLLTQKRAFVITQVSSYLPTKNQLFSLRVINEIKKQFPNVLMNFVGFSPFGSNYIERINEMISELSLQDNVRFHKSDADIPAILEKTSAFILPSIGEGFGIVLIEAQAMGVRCYVSDCTPKESDKGGCKYLSLNDSPKVWATEIINDYVKYEGRHEPYDCSEFTPEHVNEIYKKLYNGEAI